jgi:hypothetical protein
LFPELAAHPVLFDSRADFVGKCQRKDKSMNIIDEPTTVARALGQIKDLSQSLRGNGVPRITAAAEVDGKSLAEALKSLKTTIDEFLAGK